MKEGSTYVYGKHSLEEALAHTPEAIKEVLFADNFQDDSLRHRLQETSIPVHTFGSKHPPGGVDPEDVHQGVVMRVETKQLMREYNDFINNLEVTTGSRLIILGELQDPHNVGAIIRNAAAFGIDGVLIPKHRQVQVTPTVVKVSSGMIFRVPVVSIGNVNTTVDALKEEDFWVYGLTDQAEDSIIDEDFATPTVFVVGNEADGIREKTQEHCDKLISIPTQDNQPLNAAASTAVAFYAARPDEQ